MTTTYFYLYRLYRLSDGAWYIGSRVSHNFRPEDDLGTRYFCSQPTTATDFKSHPDNWSWEILDTSFVNEETLRAAESALILANWNEPGRLNRSANTLKFDRDATWQEKNTKRIRERYRDPSYRNKIAKKNQEKAQTKEWKQRVTDGSRRRSQNATWRENVARANASSEKRKKLSDAGKRVWENRDTKLSAPETRKKMSDAAKQRVSRNGMPQPNYEARQRAWNTRRTRARAANPSLPFD
jgi:hypothetical protein